MKAIVLRQPYATLVAIGVKKWETRPYPPNGPMRPEGVRGLPGLPVAPGERIAIVAGAKVPILGRVNGLEVERLLDGGLWLTGPDSSVPLPLGRVVCTAAVAEALPMVESLGSPDDPMPRIGVDVRGPYFMDRGVFPSVLLSDQLPYGDWQPGRWAWRLSDVEPCNDPYPVTGRQGVFEIGDM